jgi:hypothetical protein
MPRKKKEELPQIGDFCFLITDCERKLRQIVGVRFSENESMYKLACGSGKSWHYLIEMTGECEERPKINGFIKKTENNDEEIKNNSDGSNK